MWSWETRKARLFFDTKQKTSPRKNGKKPNLSRNNLSLYLGSRPQLHSSNLPADRFGQVRDKVDFTRVFVRRGDLFAVFLQLALQFFGGRAVLAKDDKGLDDLAAHRVML